MKTKTIIYFFIVYIFILFLVLPVPMFGQNGVVTVTHTFYFNDYDVEIDYNDHPDYTKITLEDSRDYPDKYPYGYATSREPGTPSLPVLYIPLIVPHDFGVPNLDIGTITVSSIVYLTYQIYPVQNPISNNFSPRNNTAYNNSWPPKIVKVRNIGYLYGCHQIVCLEVSPFRYTFQENNKLEFFNSITIQLTKGSESPMEIVPMPTPTPMPAPTSPGDLSYISAMLSKFVDNKANVGKYMYPNATSAAATEPTPIPTHAPLPNASPTCDYFNYVIITDDKLQDKFGSLITHKNGKSNVDSAGVITCQYIYDYFPEGDEISTGRNNEGIKDNPGKIRQYLYNASLNGTEFVLLAGDHNTVPVRYALENANENDEGIPTDLYYADINGNWDANGNGIYGEKANVLPLPGGDAVDYYPDLKVGRIPFPKENGNVTTYINNWINKVICYESATFDASGDYPMNMFSIEGPEYKNSLSASKIDPYVFLLDFKHTQATPMPGNEVVAEMSKGYGFVNWFCWGTNTKFETNNLDDQDNRWVYAKDIKSNQTQNDGLDNLTNGNDGKYSIAYTYFKDAGAYDKHGNGDNELDCIVDVWTYLNGNGGGTGILANTRDCIRYGMNFNMEQYFFFNLCIGKYNSSLPDYSRISFADQLSKAQYNDHYTCLSHNVFCCPEEKLWTDSSLIPTPTPIQSPLGDVNNDGLVDIVDALLTAQYYVNLNPKNFDQGNADVNCDGIIDIVDALLIAQYYVGLISSLADMC